MRDGGRETIGEPTLGDVIDGAAVQALLDDLYPLVGIPMSLIDVAGNVLAGVGWQLICLRYHRVHPDTLQFCLESDTDLTRDVRPGDVRRYRCKNNLWDIVTPVFVEGRHLGNVFSGQFFYEDEVVDEDLFRRQAERYGFDVDEYLSALATVPRLNRETVAHGLTFLRHLAELLGQVGCSHLAVRASERDLARAQAVAHTGSWRLDVRRDRLSWSDEACRIFGMPRGTPMSYGAFLARVHPDDRDAVDRAWTAALGGARYDLEHRIIVGDAVRWVRERAELERDRDGALVAGFGTVQDITERKRADAQLRELNATLERRVAERTEKVRAQAERLRDLSLRLARAERRERTRFARLLHNDLQQRLVVARLQAGVVARGELDPVRQAANDRLATLLEECLAASRALTLELAPLVLQDRGLLPALAWLGGWMGTQHGLHVTVTSALDAEPLDEAVRVTLFDATRELLLDVVRHAPGAAATVTADRCGNHVRIVVADDGPARSADGDGAPQGDGDGVPQEARAARLLSLHEHLEVLGGTLTVDHTPAGGLRVTMTAPADRGVLPDSPVSGLSDGRDQK